MRTLWLLPFLLAAGCRLTQPIVAGPQLLPAKHVGTNSATSTSRPPTEPDELPEPEVPLPAEVVPQPSGDVLKPEPVDTGKHSLSLQEALNRGLAQNPDLAALRPTVAVGQAAVGVAQTYPFNPYVQLEVLPYGREKAGPNTAVTNYVLVMQQLELAHQQRYRESAACANLSRTHWTLRQAELLTVAQTERLYFTAWYQRELERQAQRTAQLNARIVKTLEDRLAEGKTTQTDLSLARMQAITFEQQSELAEVNLESAIRDLCRQLGASPGWLLALADDLRECEWLPPPSALQTCASADGQSSRASPFDDLVSGRPDVMAARADADSARAGLGLARAARIPNLQTGPFYEHDDAGTVLYGFRAQMDMPVWNNGNPLMRQRLRELQAREVAYLELHKRARLEAEAAIERYEQARRMVAQAEQVIRGGLADELHQIEAEFHAGHIDALRMFAAQNNLITGYRAYLDAVNEISQAAANVTAATALPPETLIRVKHERPLD